jgi:phage-related tail protein
MSQHSSLLAVLALCAAGAPFAAPQAEAAPADPGCASLQQLGPDLTDAMTKLNSFNTTVSQLPSQYQQTNLLGMAQNIGAAGQQATELVDSLHHVSDDLQDAEDNTQDPGLRDSLEQLSGTVNQAAEDAGSYANPFAQRPDNSKLTSLAVQAGAQAVGYQINYTRVCGISFGNQTLVPGNQAPSAPSQSPAPPAAQPES